MLLMLLEEKPAFKQQNMTFWEDTKSSWHRKGLRPSCPCSWSASACLHLAWSRTNVKSCLSIPWKGQRPKDAAEITWSLLSSPASGQHVLSGGCPACCCMQGAPSPSPGRTLGLSHCLFFRNLFWGRMTAPREGLISSLKHKHVAKSPKFPW